MHQQTHTQLFQPEPYPQERPQQDERPLPRTFRASNDDRQRVTDQLQAHYVAGRLSAQELEQRVEQALAAVTLGDLDMVQADLPPVAYGGAATDQAARDQRADHPTPGQGPHGERSFRAHATWYLLTISMLVVIWAMTSPGGYFWPIWPMMGWGFGLAAHGLAARHGRASGFSCRSVLGH
jgi:hypothetical protein